MADSSENMVLRTIYLPKDLDQTLKSAAVRGERSKGDVIRELIATGLRVKLEEAGSYFVAPTASEKKPVRPTAVKRRVVSKGGAKTPRTKRALTA